MSATTQRAEQAGKTRSRLNLAIAAVGLAALAAPFAVYPVFLMNVLCFALFASAFNLLIGFVGLLSFGHAAFFGAAAYVTAHAAKVWGLPTELAILLGALAAAALGLIIGFLAIRRQGIYFSMITLALAQMFYFICLQAGFTHGEDGIQGVPRGKLLGFLDLEDNLSLYFVVLAIVVAGHLIIWRIVNSPFGNILKAIRDNEPRAISLGYNADGYKLRAFVLSAGLAGLAGGTNAIVFQLATLTGVEWQSSGEVILMTLLGGIGTLTGPPIGAAITVGLQTYLAGVDFPVTVLIGLIFVVCVLLFRRGIAGEVIAYMRKRR
ncbi:MAG: branched-chain amino acid ABC transporter permease [Hyphomicrobiales bacterium]